MKKEMVLGFLFSNGLDFVSVLIKESPEWQKGKINGIGGKMEFGETAMQSMEREFKEETGVTIKSNEWIPFGSIGGPTWKVHCFYSVNNDLFDIRTITKEQVFIFDVNDIFNPRKNVMTNLKWLIPYAINHYNDKTLGELHVNYDRNGN